MIQRSRQLRAGTWTDVPKVSDECVETGSHEDDSFLPFGGAQLYCLTVASGIALILAALFGATSLLGDAPRAVVTDWQRLEAAQPRFASAINAVYATESVIRWHPRPQPEFFTAAEAVYSYEGALYNSAPALFRGAAPP